VVSKYARLVGWIRAAPCALPTTVQMSFFDMFRSKTPAEQLRENKRMIDRSIRELDRERMKMETQEKKTVAEMKKLAKAGQKVPEISRKSIFIYS
jgi:hypothetical protein